jgi:hypothetical protein
MMRKEVAMTRIAATLSVAMMMTAAMSTLACAQDRPSIKLAPGLWRVLTKSSRDGTPLPDKTEDRCYSAAELDDLATTFATLFTDHDCDRTHSIAGKTLTLAATCQAPAPQGGTLVVKGEGSYVFEDEKHFASSIVSTFAVPNQPTTAFTTRKSAEHVGPCPN